MSEEFPMMEYKCEVCGLILPIRDDPEYVKGFKPEHCGKLMKKIK
jgi:DNA-directed RNA polymerase subunit RPC12/RpoP